MDFIKSILKNIHLFHTKDNVRNRPAHPKSVYIIVAAILFISFVPSHMISAATGLKIYNYTTKKNVTYTDKQILVTYNGKQISKKDTPGILQNGVALVSYKDIFANSPIKAACEYNKSKGTVTIKKNGITIVLTINSRVAKVNGKSVTMSVAPVKIKYRNSDVTKILVPSRFVSENLGYDYVWNSSKSTVAISKQDQGLPLSYDGGSMFYYKGALTNLTIDGEVIGLGNMPGIIESNTTMIRAKRVFADSSINANYTYNSKKKELVLSLGETELVMTMGSKTAYVNGKAVTLDRAPSVVMNHETMTSFVMVPAKNTTELLGYKYVWDNASRTSIITLVKAPDNNVENPPALPDNNEPNGNEPLEPELGDSGVDTTGIILKEWNAVEQMLFSPTGQKDIEGISDGSPDSGYISSINRDYSQNFLNAETYVIASTTPFRSVSTSLSGQSLTLVTDKLGYASEENYELYSNMLRQIRSSYLGESGETKFEFELTSEKYLYDISLSSDQMFLYVTLYQPTLRSVALGTNDAGDYILLSADNIHVNVTDEHGILTIDIPNVVNGLGSINEMIQDAAFMNYIFSIDYTDKTQIILQTTGEYKLITSEAGNQSAILLHFTYQTPQPVDPNPTVPVDPDPVEISNPDQYAIRIPKPQGVTRSVLKDYDEYMNLRFSIVLPGDHTSVINSSNILNKASTVKNIQVYLDGNNQTVILFTTSKLQGYEYVADQNYIYVKVGNPRDIYPFIVALDPGHGRSASGAFYFNTKEKDLNFKMLYTIGSKYFNSDPSTMKVYYTRISDTNPSLAERAAYASKMGADLFVSLHMNASTASKAYGTEVYYSTHNKAKTKSGLDSMRFAKIMVDNLCNGLKSNNRGAKAEAYTVVKNNTVPAILIELGFLSNADDFAKISNSEYQEKAMKIVYETLLQVNKTYPTGR